MSRVQAPKLNDGRHPDWFISHSGGIDSTSAALLTYDAIETSRADGNYSKKPLAIYLDTRIGVPLNRFFVEEFCDWLGVQVWTLRTDESFLEWLRRSGSPGGGAHGNVRNELKGRQSSKLSTLADFPVFILGLAADESEERAALSKVVEKKSHIEVYPVHRLTRKERVEIVLRSGCPLNPLWMYPDVITDCGCLANGDPSELEKTEELFPWFGQRLREWEESISFDGLKGTLGWQGMTGVEKNAIEAGQEQLTLCSDGCQRKRDPNEVRAIRARAEGATIDQSVEVLYGGGGVASAV